MNNARLKQQNNQRSIPENPKQQWQVPQPPGWFTVAFWLLLMGSTVFTPILTRYPGLVEFNFKLLGSEGQVRVDGRERIPALPGEPSDTEHPPPQLHQ